MPLKKRPASARTKATVSPGTKKRRMLDIPSTEEVFRISHTRKLHLCVMGIAGKIMEEEVDSTLSVGAAKALVAKKMDVPPSILKLLQELTPINDCKQLHQFALANDRNVKLTAITCFDLLCRKLQSESISTRLQALRDLLRIGPRCAGCPINAILDCLLHDEFKVRKLALSAFKVIVRIEGMDKQPVVNWVLEQFAQDNEKAVDRAIDAAKVVACVDNDCLHILVEWLLKELRSAPNYGRIAMVDRISLLWEGLAEICEENCNSISALTRAYMMTDEHQFASFAETLSEILRSLVREGHFPQLLNALLPYVCCEDQVLARLEFVLFQTKYRSMMDIGVMRGQMRLSKSSSDGVSSDEECPTCPKGGSESQQDLYNQLVPLLCDLCRSEHLRVKLLALRALTVLARIGDAHVLPVACSILRDAQSDVRRIPSGMERKDGDECDGDAHDSAECHGDFQLHNKIVRTALRVVAFCSPTDDQDVIEATSALLTNSDGRMRSAALWALNQILDPRDWGDDMGTFSE